jgi:hypothetical protein
MAKEGKAGPVTPTRPPRAKKERKAVIVRRWSRRGGGGGGVVEGDGGGGKGGWIVSLGRLLVLCRRPSSISSLYISALLLWFMCVCVY